MKFAVIVFPGSNCDVDMYHAIKDRLTEKKAISNAGASVAPYVEIQDISEIPPNA